MTAKKNPSYQWWDEFGGTLKHLKPIAVVTLAQVVSQSASESSWSEYDYIHNKKRNRLNLQTCNNLLYVHNNLRLMRRITSVTYSQEVRWLGDGDSDTDEEMV